MGEPEEEFLGIFRDEANERLDSMSTALLAIEEGRSTPETIDGLFRDAHTIKGGAAMLGLDEIGALAHAVEDVLAIARARGTLAPALADPLLRAGDALRSLVSGDEPQSAEATAALLADLALGAAGDDAGSVAAVVGSAIAVAQPSPEGNLDGAAGRGRTVRVPAEKLDVLLDLVGETVLHRRRLGHMIASGGEAQRLLLADELDAGDRLLGALQDAALQTRTLPFGSITGPFPRALRDSANAAGKEVELVVHGTGTELDRVILETLSEPLVHLLRNTVAHGIESPAERAAAGKAAVGRVVLTAEQRGALVAVIVSDDGRGVSADLAAQAAREGGLVEVMTRPGFSTAAVTDLAGRGVGLDVVRAHVDSFGGSMQVESEPGFGTTITLLLPLTLALLEVLLVERGSQAFGVPLANVVEAVRPDETHSLGGRRSIAVRGTSIPIYDLALALGLQAHPLPRRAPVIVVAADGHQVALATDRLLGESEVVVKSLGPLLRSVSGYLGAAILGDGRVALLIDPGPIAKLRARPRHDVADASHRPGETDARTLLIVEDSFMVRELQRSILEAAGYRVETARNGREALDHLASGSAIQLVITDVDMPEMDGLELTAAIRASGEWSALPIIVVTSRASELDRRRGVEAGADAYMVKDRFDQHRLLELVGELLGGR